MKYSTTKTTPTKMNNSVGKALVKSPSLKKSQKKTEVCQMYVMQLRSGLIIKKARCFRKEITKKHSPKTAGKKQVPRLLFAACQRLAHVEVSVKSSAFDTSVVKKCTRTTDGSSLQECSASLSTYNDQSITFACADGGYEIYVEDSGKKQEKDTVLFRYYDLKLPSSETGDDVDGHKLMVSLSPTKDKDFLLHANNKEYSVELQKCENPLPDQTFFFLHKEPSPSTCVSFECKNDPGVFIGVKDNQLALIKLKDQTEPLRRDNIKFKIS